jgi:hypothetical protein
VLYVSVVDFVEDFADERRPPLQSGKAAGSGET